MKKAMVVLLGLSLILATSMAAAYELILEPTAWGLSQASPSSLTGAAIAGTAIAAVVGGLDLTGVDFTGIQAVGGNRISIDGNLETTLKAHGITETQLSTFFSGGAMAGLVNLSRWEAQPDIKISMDKDYKVVGKAEDGTYRRIKEDGSLESAAVEESEVKTFTFADVQDTIRGLHAHIAELEGAIDRSKGGIITKIAETSQILANLDQAF